MKRQNLLEEIRYCLEYDVNKTTQICDNKSCDTCVNYKNNPRFKFINETYEWLSIFEKYLINPSYTKDIENIINNLELYYHFKAVNGKLIYTRDRLYGNDVVKYIQKIYDEKSIYNRLLYTNTELHTSYRYMCLETHMLAHILYNKKNMNIWKKIALTTLAVFDYYFESLKEPEIYEWITYKYETILHSIIDGRPFYNTITKKIIQVINLDELMPNDCSWIKPRTYRQELNTKAWWP